MAKQKESKRAILVRDIRPYTRRISGTVVRVSGYKQIYHKPRGKVNPLRADKKKSSSKTEWLMDRSGKFVGRANAKGKTTAKGYKYSGTDNTSNIREQGRYGRIYGRTKSNG